MIGGATAALMFKIGGSESLSFEAKVIKVIAHGVVGGVSSRLNGGKFKAGFLAAAFGKMTGGKIRDISQKVGPVAGTIASAVAGGLGSRIGGGKFENGAVTGAFVAMFNDFAPHDDTERKYQSLRVKVSGFFVTHKSPHAIMVLSADDIQVVMQWSFERILGDGWNPFDAISQFGSEISDTFFFNWGHRGFYIDGQVYRGGDINYLMVGMRAEYYAADPITRNAMVVIYNLNQQDYRQANPFGPATEWAARGAEYMRNYWLRH